MKIKEAGEFGFIDRIARRNALSEKAGTTGIGDDCAVFPKGDGISCLVTADLLVEGRHFLSGRISPYDLGYKSLAVSVSDVTAMGGEAKYSFLSLSIDPETPVEWADAFFEGYRSLGVPLLGGDTTAADPGHTVINVTVIGEAKNENIKYRSGARPGDIVVVTGALGRSAAGLQALLAGKEKDYPALAAAHTRPVIGTEAGVWLGKQPGVHAMMDVSDGVASDVKHLCRQSRCGVRIRTEQLPVDAETIRLCRDFGLDPVETALSGGEDYCLLLTADPNGFDILKRQYERLFGETFFPIGEITESDIRFFDQGNETAVRNGFTHF